jgi:hypothetical protein
MTLDRIMTWRFADAPLMLRSLHVSADEPEWLIFVPQSIQAPDVDQAVRSTGPVSSYPAGDGGIVYIGSARVI